MGRITSISLGVDGIFDGGAVAEIHSVYKNTINFCYEKQIYAIQPFDAWFTPMSIRVDRMPDLKGDDKVCVILDREGMSIGEAYYHRELYERQNCMIGTSAARQTELAPLLNMIKMRLSRSSGGIASALVRTGVQGEVSRKAHCICQRTTYFLRTGSHGEAVDELISMIGLGPGLTPSGDDFLIGILAVLWVKGDQKFLQLLRQKIVQNLTKTNDISASYLYHACHGEFSEPFHLLFTKKEKVAAVNKMASVGHSSGTDALAGICFGLEQFGLGG